MQEGNSSILTVQETVLLPPATQQRTHKSMTTLFGKFIVGHKMLVRWEEEDEDGEEN